MPPLASFWSGCIVAAVLAVCGPAQHRNLELPPAAGAAGGDLPLLPRFSALRRLQINPDTDGKWGDWQRIEVDALAPLCALPELEQLTLPYCASLSPSHLRRLTGCKRLATMQFLTDNLRLDAAAATALAEWPALRHLQFSLIVVSAEGIAALAAVPRLERLGLWNCRELDGAGWAALCTLKNLRELSLGGLGQPDILARLQRGEQVDSWAPDLAAIRALAKLPALRELELADCVLVPGALAALPQHLSALTCRGGSLVASQVRELRQHGALRTLRLGDTGGSDEAQDEFRREVAGLLGVLRLEVFHWSGAVPAELRQAIAGQADLRELGLPTGDGLGIVTGLPKLERLELWQRLPARQPDAAAASPLPAAPMPAELAPLRASKSLRVVVYHGRDLFPAALAELQTAIGPRIELQLRD
jgi:hypothetical protein